MTLKQDARTNDSWRSGIAGLYYSSKPSTPEQAFSERIFARLHWREYVPVAAQPARTAIFPFQTGRSAAYFNGCHYRK